MSTLTIILLTLAIIFMAALTRSTFGFGDALLAMPLLTLLVGVQTATPLMAFVGPTIASTIVWRHWRSIDFGATWHLIISTVLGIPVGIFVLKTAPEEIVKQMLGLLIILISLYNLIRPRLITLSQRRWAYLFGFVAGVIGSAYNTNGPPIVIYGVMRRWPPDRFRATLQGYFLPTGLLILAGHGLAGLWTLQVLQLYALALPFMVTAIFLGTKLNQRIPPHRFEKFIYAALLALGFLLLI
ncbi:MAG: sulfite exporter TauE/SafE family protein [Anaerolineae bacterium]|nr:sulfite exporter TauE/SafE family protein [Anaerolineae bacterium]